MIRITGNPILDNYNLKAVSKNSAYKNCFSNKFTDFLQIIQIIGEKYISLQQKLNDYEQNYLYYRWCKT